MNKPHYQKDNIKLFLQLEKEIYAELGKEFQQKAARINEWKAVVLVILFFALLVGLWLFNDNYLLFYVLLGILSLPMVLNIGHESVHDNLSDRKWVNRSGRYVYYLLGTRGYFWEIRHNFAHHAFANVRKWDLDFGQSSLIRLSKSQPHYFFNKFQVIYMPFLYLHYTLIWFFIRDFLDIFRKHFGVKRIERHPWKEIVLLFVAKVWHIAAFILIPVWMGYEVSTAFTGFFIFHISASLMTTLALISTHVGEEQEIVDVGKEGQLPYNWFVHQLKTTADFSTVNSSIKYTALFR